MGFIEMLVIWSLGAVTGAFGMRAFRKASSPEAALRHLLAVARNSKGASFVEFEHDGWLSEVDEALR